MNPDDFIKNVLSQFSEISKEKGIGFSVNQRAALEEALRKETEKYNLQLTKKPNKINNLREDSNSNFYLLLPETKDHPELITNLTKLSYSPEIQKIAKLNLINNDQGYLGNIKFNQAQEIASKLEGIVETPSLFVEKLKILKSGKGYDKEGNKHDPKKLENAFNEITQVRSPLRAQWLNHKYSLDQKENLQVTYHKFIKGKIEQITELLDPETLMEDRTPGIDLEDWLNNPTSQGLPKNSVKEGNLYYWYPRNDSVAGFYAVAGRVCLNCYGDPAGSDPALGVAVAKIFHKK